LVGVDGSAGAADAAGAGELADGRGAGEGVEALVEADGAGLSAAAWGLSQPAVARRRRARICATFIG
jgi:hypothetical protein